MRRVTTPGGERWRCLKCLEETGWRPRHKHHHHHHEKAHKERLVDAILREPNPVRHEKSALGRSLLASLAFHAMVVSLQFGSQGSGLPWLRSAPDERLAQAATIHAVLRLPPRTEAMAARIGGGAGAPETPPPPPPPPRAGDGMTLASLRGGATAAPATEPRRANGAPRPAMKPSKTAARKKGAEVLATDTKSAWQVPVAQVDGEGREASEHESVPAAHPPPSEIVDAVNSGPAEEKADETAAALKAAEAARERKQAEERAREAAELAEKERQIAAEKARQEALERLQAEAAEQLRVEAEQKNAGQAAAAKAALEAQERKLAEQAADRARQEAIERKRAEEELRANTVIAAEKRKAEETALAKTRQEALERQQRDELARIAAERRQAEQAAAAKAGQEAQDRQRAADLERGRRAAAANPAQNGAQSGAERADGRGLDPATRGAEQPGSAPDTHTPREALGADPRRKASIVGPDPKNIQLAFYGEGWRQKIERIGAVNYPRLYKDRYYDNLIVTVTINSDGTLAGVRIDKSSGQPEMDDAVRRIVEMSAPFAAFPPDLKRNFDQIDITRTWVFEQRPRIRNQ